jgi:hypothetical protein
MADLTVARPISPLGDADQVQIPIIAVPMSANLQIWGGGMVASDTSGNLVKADAGTAVIVLGTARKNVNNLNTNPPFGAAGAIVAEVVLGVQPMNISTDGGAITNANRYQDVFVVDDQTISLSDGGGARLRAGYLFNIDPTSGLANVMFGDATPTARAAAGGAASASTAYKARAVVTALSGAYTGSTTGVLTASANAAFGTQDGVATLAVGDTVFLPEGTTNITAASDAGPYVITALGAAGAKWILTRPSWWETAAVVGTAVPIGAIIEIGGEGTNYGGSEWKIFAAKGQIIDTNAPLLWPKVLNRSVTLVAGTATAITNMPVRGTTGQTAITFFRTTINTATATIQYGVVPVPTAGAIGTASIVPMAQVGAGTINNADISTLIMTVTNW